jgi:Protein of unknown function, DUF417
MMKLSDASDSDSYASIDAGLRVQGVGSLVLRYGLVLVIAGIGLMKFTEYEAKGIEPLVAHKSADGLDVWLSDSTCIFRCTGCCRGCYYDFDWPSTLVSEGVSAWQRRSCAHVSNHPFLLAFDARVGTEPRWVSLALCPTRTIPVERRGIARCSNMVIW